MSSSDGRTGRIRIVTASADRQVAAAVLALLDRRGVPAEVDGPDSAGGRVVVLISAAAVQDRRWNDTVSGLDAAERIVPVRVGAVEARSIPELLRDLNWIDWSATDPARTGSQIFTALNSDLETYRTHRRLRADAGAWNDAGRPVGLLLASRRAATDALVHVRHARHDLLSRPDEIVVAYVEASDRETRRRSRRKRRTGLAALALIVTVGVAFAAVAIALRTAGKASDLTATGSAMASDIDNRPDRVAMVSAGALVQQGYGNRRDLRTAAARALTQPWAAGVLGGLDAHRILDVAFDSRGERAVTVDGDGILTLWDTGTDVAIRALQVHGALQTGVLDADSSLTTVAVVSGKQAHLIDLSDGADRVSELPEAGSAVVLAPERGYSAVETTDGAIYTVDAASGVVAPSPVTGTVLDLARNSGGDAHALVRRGREVSVVDVRSGAVVVSAGIPENPLEKGALGTSGEIALTGADRQIHFGVPKGAGVSVRPTGQAVPDTVDVLEVLPERRVAFGGAQFGVRVFDDRAGAEVGEICRGSAGVAELAVAPDGDLVGCIDSYVSELWRTRSLSPLDGLVKLSPAPKPDRIATAAYEVGRSPAGDLSITRRSGGAPDVIASDGAGPVRSIVATDTGVAAGTDGGVVVQVALDGGPPVEVGRWSVPGGESVTRVDPDPSDAYSLLITTGSGSMWRVPSCLGCGSETAIVAQVRSRLWGCYTDNQVELLTDASREALGIRACMSSPDPEG